MSHLPVITVILTACAAIGRGTRRSLRHCLRQFLGGVYVGGADQDRTDDLECDFSVCLVDLRFEASFTITNARAFMRWPIKDGRFVTGASSCVRSKKGSKHFCFLPSDFCFCDWWS